MLDKQLRHSPVSIPLAIGGDDVPRRALGVAALEYCAIGLQVRRPLCTLVDIAGVVLPVLGRVIEPGDQSLFLRSAEEMLRKHLINTMPWSIRSSSQALISS